MSFAQLKKKSKSNLSDLTEKLSNLTKKQTVIADERLWYPAVDKTGNGFAIIRFLPEVEGEDVPFIRRYNHGFQKDPKDKSSPWLIQNCPTSLGRDHKCPICEHNTVLWNAGEKSTVGRQKRQLSFYSNVLVLKDPANPENEGKVKIFRYGKKIFDKLEGAMNPNPALGDDPINPFDPWTGANFRLIITTTSDGYRNYDTSKFDAPKVMGTDSEIEAIWKQQYPLQPFLDPSEFKSYDDLKGELLRVLGVGDSSGSAPKQSTKKGGHSHSAKPPVDDDDEDALIARKLQALAAEDDEIPF